MKAVFSTHQLNMSFIIILCHFRFFRRCAPHQKGALNLLTEELTEELDRDLEGVRWVDAPAMSQSHSHSSNSCGQ